MALLDEVRRIAQGAGGVGEQAVLLCLVVAAEQRTGLAEVVGVVLTEIPEVGVTADLHRRLAVLRLFLPLAVAVRLVVRQAAVVAVHAHRTVAVVAVHRAACGVHRNLVVVHAQAVALRIGIGEQACLQHLVRRRADAGHQIARCERGLLHVLVPVDRVAVQFELAHFDQRVVALRPHLGQVERMDAVGFRLQLGHDLDEQLPLREVALLDCGEQVAAVAFAVMADQDLRLRVGQRFDALLADEVELHPEALAVGVGEAVGVRAEAVHVAEAARDAAVAHHHGHLQQGFGQQRPEVPVVARAAQVGMRVAFHGLVEVGELARVAQEEHRRVVADQVPVAFFGVELQCEAADVTLGVGGATLAGHRGEAREHLGLLADLLEQLGTGVLADVVGDGESTERARALGVHAALGNDLAVEVGQLLQQPDVFHQQRATWAGGLAVLVVHHRCAEGRGHRRDRIIAVLLLGRGAQFTLLLGAFRRRRRGVIRALGAVVIGLAHGWLLRVKTGWNIFTRL